MSNPLDKSLDELVDLTRRRRPTSCVPTHGGVRAAGEQVGDRVSADRGNLLARTGGEGRRREEGTGEGKCSRRVPAKQARDAELSGKVAGAVSKSSDRPKRTKPIWRHIRVSADNEYPHGAKGQSGERKRPRGGRGY